LEFEWDEAKRFSNLRKHGVDFVRVLDFDWETAVRFEDNRRPYGEERWLALGKIGERLHTLVYTIRFGRTRVISLRRSKRQEVAVYEKASRSSDA
jgi:uncharacterized DUF497 family protein